MHQQTWYWPTKPEYSASSIIRVKIILTQFVKTHFCKFFQNHLNDVILSAMASQITGVSTVYSTVCSAADQRKHQRSASLAFVRGTRRWPVNSPHKGPVTRKIFIWWRHHVKPTYFMISSVYKIIIPTRQIHRKHTTDHQPMKKSNVTRSKLATEKLMYIFLVTMGTYESTGWASI